MAGNVLRASVELDDGGVTKKLHGISQAFDKIGGKGSGASLFGNVAAKGVAKGFDIIASSIGGVVDLLGDAITAAADDQASTENLRTALLNNVPAWDKNMDAINRYIDAQIDRGFSDDDTRESLGQLVGVTHDVTKAQELLTLAEDLARAKHIPLAQATDIVTKAALGNSKALKPLGIDIGKTADAAAILDGIQKNVAGSADTYNDTLAGKLNVSQLKYNEAMEKIGYTLMPVVADLMQKFADDWLPALGRGWDKVVAAIRPVLEILGRVIGALKDAIGFVGDLLKKISDLGAQYNAGNANFRPKIPGHAEGGWVGLNGPEMAIVGERGPEYVIPNNQLRIPNGGGGGGHGHEIYLDGVKVGELLDRRNGIKLRRSPIAGFNT